MYEKAARKMLVKLTPVPLASQGKKAYQETSNVVKAGYHDYNCYEKDNFDSVNIMKSRYSETGVNPTKLFSL